MNERKKTSYTTLIDQAVKELNDRGANMNLVPKEERARSSRIEKMLHLTAEKDDRKQFMKLLREWFSIFAKTGRKK